MPSAYTSLAFPLPLPNAIQYWVSSSVTDGGILFPPSFTSIDDRDDTTRYYLLYKQQRYKVYLY